MAIDARNRTKLEALREDLPDVGYPIGLLVGDSYDNAFMKAHDRRTHVRTVRALWQQVGGGLCGEQYALLRSFGGAAMDARHDRRA